MNKSFWAIIAAIVIIFGGIIVLNKSKEQSTTNAQPTNHIVGSETSGVKLVEYADYQCPFCAQYYPVVKQVIEKYKDRIQFQYRNFPLPQHQNARAAARAAEAADKQGKFWEMHDLIFQNQSTWADSTKASATFEQYAVQLGLKLDQFKKDVASSQTNDIINADISEFDKTKQEPSTPTFLLDGKKIQPVSVDEFSTLIDAAIAAKAKI